jgi:chemotaxis protein methyltransferase CheR
MVTIQAEEFKVLSKYIKSLTGIHLDDSKKYLVENRLHPLLKELGGATYSELYYKAQADATKKVAAKIVDAITTGETSFFRDTSPFELFQHKVLPDLIDRRTRKPGVLNPIPIRIWSAACSTGQEIYSTAILLKEMQLDPKKFSVRMLGTDISDEAVARASCGVYNKFEIERGLTAAQLQRYFVPEKDRWKIRDELRGMATFRRLNLMEPFSHLGKFDIVLCRNVAIYFADADRVNLFNRIGGALEGDGCLIIGSTESLTGICPQFEPKRYLRSVYYQLK